eukprot:4982469-Amphidinium_carterae.1
MGTMICKATTLTQIANATPTLRDNFIPTQAAQDNSPYIWWMWLTRPQYAQYVTDGTIPRYKETRGDTVLKHHRLHNTPDKCINLHIHTRWKVQSASDVYNATSATFFRRGNRQCQTSWATVAQWAGHSATFTTGVQRTFRLSSAPHIDGPTIGTWPITDWTKPDSRHNDSLWFDHNVGT